MCIIVYKPSEKKLPTKKTLQECFRRNPDGAGFMWNDKKTGKVQIRKGFMGFRSFWRALREIDDIEKCDVIMHFRITTQGGTRQDCCHPFPVSENMEDLRQLKFETEIGVAHNGIIDLTTTYKKVDYSDTMEFITKYLALMIKDWSYYKNHNILTLIERLINSKMAILDKKGHVELIGNFIEDDGIFYSNSSYKSYVTKYNTGFYYDVWDDYSNDIYTSCNISTNENTTNSDKYNTNTTGQTIDEYVESEAFECYDDMTDTFFFNESFCPINYGVDSYCDRCVNYMNCYKMF